LYPHQNHIKTHQNHDIVSPHPDGYAIHVPPFSVRSSHIQQFPPLKKPAFFQRFARFASPKNLPRSHQGTFPLGEGPTVQLATHIRDAHPKGVHVHAFGLGFLDELHELGEKGHLQNFRRISEGDFLVKCPGMT